MTIIIVTIAAIIVYLWARMEAQHTPPHTDPWEVRPGKSARIRTRPRRSARREPITFAPPRATDVDALIVELAASGQSMIERGAR